MTVALGIFAFFLILAGLVFAHELGHFASAKFFGIRVEEFGMGFPPRVKGWRRGGTVYSLNAIPLGGFVRMLGENGRHDSPDSFGAKPPWQRLIVLVAGPAMNILLAVVIFFGVYLHGSQRGVTVITAVSPGSPAALAHLRVGDRVIALDGQRLQYLDELVPIVHDHLGQVVTLLVQRGNGQISVNVEPRRRPPHGQGPIGITMNDSANVAYSPGDALQQSVQQVQMMVTAVPSAIAHRVSAAGGSGTVVGPIGIAHITTKVVQHPAQDRLTTLFALAALLSANLGILNLLPFPALDGGRIVFVLISWVRRRNLSPEVEGLIHLAGMAVLLTLILLVSYQDLVRLATNGSF